MTTTGVPLLSLDNTSDSFSKSPPPFFFSVISFKFFLGGLETKGGKHLALLDPEKKIYLFLLVSFSVANPCISIQGTSCSGLKNGTVKILSQVGAYQSMVAEFHGVGDARGALPAGRGSGAVLALREGTGRGCIGLHPTQDLAVGHKGSKQKDPCGMAFPHWEEGSCSGVAGFCCRH